MLDICKKLFEYFNSNKIRYCHWKSNVHLDKALQGKTDLDVLIHRADKDKFELACRKFDLKKIMSPPEKQFPGMEDYLGFDNNTGELIHLHVHYLLVLGEKYIKNHHLPIEEIVFDHLTQKQNVYIPICEMELLLLVIRAHMKVDAISLVKHGIKYCMGRFYTPFPTDIEREFLDLIQNSDDKKLGLLLKKCGFPISDQLFFDFFKQFSEKKISPFSILKNKWQITKGLERYRRNKSVLVYWDYFSFYVRALPLINKVLKEKRKILPYTGKIFSLVGADGSGKSTLKKDLQEWLSWKLSLKTYYYGIPKTRYLHFISYVIRGFNKFKLTFFARLFECYYWAYVAKNRHGISKRSRKQIEQGITILTDRFPMMDFHTMKEPMDGPRLKQYTRGINAYFSKREAYHYDEIKMPDCILVLQVDIDELRKRKTDLDIQTHREKADAVNAVKRRDGVVLISANKAYADVQLDIKREIWALL